MTAKEIIESMTKEDAINLWLKEICDWDNSEGRGTFAYITKQLIADLKGRYKIIFDKTDPNMISIERCI